MPDLAHLNDSNFAQNNMDYVEKFQVTKKKFDPKIPSWLFYNDETWLLQVNLWLKGKAIL